MKLFDYMYYRTYSWYEKRDQHPWIYAEGVVSVVQFFFLLNFYILLKELTGWNLSNIVNGKVVAGVLIILIIVINNIRYKKKIDIKKLKKDYHNEEISNKKRLGFFLVVLIAILILAPMLLGILRHNFHVID